MERRGLRPPRDRRLGAWELESGRSLLLPRPITAIPEARLSMKGLTPIRLLLNQGWVSIPWAPHIPDTPKVESILTEAQLLSASPELLTLGQLSTYIPELPEQKAGGGAGGGP